MVQFGNYLKVFRFEQWKDHYIHYEKLKELLYILQEAAASSKAIREQDIEEGQAFQDQLRSDLQNINQFFLDKRVQLAERLGKVIRYLEHWKELEGVTPETENARALKLAQLQTRNNRDEEELHLSDELTDFERGGPSPDTADLHGKQEGYVESAEWDRRRRALMSEFQSLYAEVLLLKDFSSLNYTGFAMILKKHDKLLPQWACKAAFIKTEVNSQPVFGFLDDLQRLQQEVVIVYADEFLNGNRMDADISLGASLASNVLEKKKKKKSHNRAMERMNRSLVYATSQSMPVFNEEQLWWVEQERREENRQPRDGLKDKSAALWRRARVTVMAVNALTRSREEKRHSIRWTILMSLVLILVGGMIQSISLEHIVREYTGAGPTISFFQFLFVALEGFRNYVEPSNSNFLGLGFKKRQVPLLYHCAFLVCSWLATVLSAAALDWHISLASSMIIKSTTLLINMTMGYLALSRTYSRKQVASVILLTAAVITYTMQSVPSDSDPNFDLPTYLVGLSLLIGGLICTGLIGVIQDMTFRKYGKHWREMMFYAHFLGLFLFLMLADDIFEHAVLWTQESPIVWLYMCLNTLAQFMCIKGIYQFISLTNSLTGSLVLTVRKFLLVVTSVIVFDNTFTSIQWASVLVVLVSTIMYTYTSQMQSDDEPEDESEPAKKLTKQD